MIPTDPDDRIVLAGEFVLGTLDQAQSQEIRSALPADADLRREVALWEQQLHPLSALAGEAAPPADLWPRIAARLPAPRQALGSRRLWNSAPFWRATALAATALAAGLALFIAVRPPPAPAPAPTLVSLAATDTHSPAWITALSAGELTLQPLGPQAPPAGHDFQFWVIGRGEKTPHSLGVLPADRRLALHTLPAQIGPGATLAISIEPRGGSPTGLPTGPVVFAGTIGAPS